MAAHHKKDDLPAMPFYVGDWMKAPDIRACTLEQRGLWFDLICLMWESPIRGVLINQNGLVFSEKQIARMLGENPVLVNQIIKELEEIGVFSRRPKDNAIFCRRMVKDEKIREIRRRSGRKGGNPNLVNQNSNQEVNQEVNQNSNQNTENENENENELKPKTLLSSSNNNIKESKQIKEKNRSPKFVPPTVAEVVDYVFEKRYTFDPESFWNFYESKGWKIGSSPMKSWRAACVTWQKRQPKKCEADQFKNGDPKPKITERKNQNQPSSHGGNGKPFQSAPPKPLRDMVADEIKNINRGSS